MPIREDDECSDGSEAETCALMLACKHDQTRTGGFQQTERHAKQLQAASAVTVATEERVAEGRYEEGAARPANS